MKYRRKTQKKTTEKWVYLVKMFCLHDFSKKSFFTIVAILQVRHCFISIPRWRLLFLLVLLQNILCEVYHKFKAKNCTQGLKKHSTLKFYLGWLLRTFGAFENALVSLQNNKESVLGTIHHFNLHLECEILKRRKVCTELQILA